MCIMRNIEWDQGEMLNFAPFAFELVLNANNGWYTNLKGHANLHWLTNLLFRPKIHIVFISCNVYEMLTLESSSYQSLFHSLPHNQSEFNEVNNLSPAYYAHKWISGTSPNTGFPTQLEDWKVVVKSQITALTSPTRVTCETSRKRS